MIGKPLYGIEDTVIFKLNNKEITGKIIIIDKFGTFEQNNDVSYDIMDKDKNILYKHVIENNIIKKV